MTFFHHCMSWSSRVSLLSAFAAGGCLGIGFIVPVLWPLSIVGIIACLNAAVQTASYRQAVTYGCVAWLVKALASLVWFFSAYPIAWIEFSSPLQQLGCIFLYWLSAGLSLAVGGGWCLLALRYVWTVKGLSPRVWYWLVPVIWLLGELMSALVFSLVTLGPGSFIQTYFSFGMVGYLIGMTPGGVFLAAGYGVYGLSLILVGLATFVYLVLNMSFSRIPLFSGGAVVVIVGVLHSSLLFSQTYSPIGVTLIGVDTTFDAEYLLAPSGQNQRADILETAITAALKMSPDFILLPEDARYLASFDASDQQKALQYYQFLHPGTSSYVIDSGRLDTPTLGTVLRATIFSSATNTLEQFDKQYLVPQGEYVPYMYGGALRLLGFREAVDTLMVDNPYSTGPLSPTTLVPGNIPGVLFCFESVRPDGVSALTSSRTVPFIAHPISHGWFHTPYVLWRQLDVMLQIQARHSGVPIVSAGNMVTGKLYLPTGKMVEGRVVGSGERYELKEYQF